MPRFSTIERIERCLTQDGYSADRTAVACRCSRGYVYRVASDNAWPTNPSITPHSPKESQIVAASRILTGRELSCAFSLAPINVERVLKRVDRRTRKDVAQMGNGTR